MLKIKNTLSFAALICGLLICFNAPAAAQGFIPPGSYKSSCVLGADPKFLAFYNTQNIGYTDVVIAETAKLNSKPFVRRVMINAAYKKTMGRPPTVGDYAYWEPRTEYFTQIVDAARAYLYSPNGANDLAETVKRALSSNMSGEPTSAQIKSAIVKYTPNKTIFDEM